MNLQLDVFRTLAACVKLGDEGRKSEVLKPFTSFTSLRHFVIFGELRNKPQRDFRKNPMLRCGVFRELSMFTRTTFRLPQISRQLLPYQTRTMATLNTKFKLNTGAEIREFPLTPHIWFRILLTLLPAAIGFGTWQDADAQEDAVTEALKAGYKHIDTARM